MCWSPWLVNDHIFLGFRDIHRGSESKANVLDFGGVGQRHLLFEPKMGDD